MLYGPQHTPDEILMCCSNALHFGDDRSVGGVLFENVQTTEARVQIPPLVGTAERMQDDVVIGEPTDDRTSRRAQHTQFSLRIARQKEGQSSS
jgi:hypothetical protein